MVSQFTLHGWLWHLNRCTLIEHPMNVLPNGCHWHAMECASELHTLIDVLDKIVKRDKLHGLNIKNEVHDKVNWLCCSSRSTESMNSSGSRSCRPSDSNCLSSQTVRWRKATSRTSRNSIGVVESPLIIGPEPPWPRLVVPKRTSRTRWKQLHLLLCILTSKSHIS